MPENREPLISRVKRIDLTGFEVVGILLAFLAVDTGYFRVDQNKQ